MSQRDLRLKVGRRLRAAGVSLEPAEQDRLVSFFGLMAKWNRHLNLTALQLEPESNEAIDRLLVEPAVAAQAVNASEHLLVDIGSGGGSPAIPLKLCVPRLRLVMVEVKARKAAFLRDASRQLALDDVEVANCRFEELLVRQDLHERADVVSVRAVRADQKLWSPLQSLLRPDGRLFWFTSTGQKGPGVESGFLVDSTLPLPGTSRLVVLRKSR